MQQDSNSDVESVLMFEQDRSSPGPESSQVLTCLFLSTFLQPQQDFRDLKTTGWSEMDAERTKEALTSL